MKRNSKEQKKTTGYSGYKRGLWTSEEDRVLMDHVKVHGKGKWNRIPRVTGLKRCGKSCRLRWMNYLSPTIKRGHFSTEEDDLIIRLHRLLGNRWSLIAGRVPGRTDNQVKNHWNSHLSKKQAGVDSLQDINIVRKAKLPQPSPSQPPSKGDVVDDEHNKLPAVLIGLQSVATTNVDVERQQPPNTVVIVDSHYKNNNNNTVVIDSHYKNNNNKDDTRGVVKQHGDDGGGARCCCCFGLRVTTDGDVDNCHNNDNNNVDRNDNNDYLNDNDSSSQEMMFGFDQEVDDCGGAAAMIYPTSPPLPPVSNNTATTATAAAAVAEHYAYGDIFDDDELFIINGRDFSDFLSEYSFSNFPWEINYSSYS